MLHRRTMLSSMIGGIALAALPRTSLAKRAPALKLFDTHAHFYTNDPDRYPFNARAARYGAEKMIAKAMANPMTPDVIFKFWDEAGIARGCGVQYNSTYSTDNRYLLDIAAQHPDRIIPVVILAPTDPATPAALERMAKDNRISGVRFTGLPDAAGNYAFLGAAAGATWAAADRLGLTIVLMPIGGNMPPAMARVAELAALYPNVNIVLDHIGFPKPEIGPSFGLSPEHVALARHRNVYYKYTTLLIEQLQAAKVPTTPFLTHMVRVYGADHLVWGSDVGNTEGNPIDFVHHALDSAAGLTATQRKAVFYDTAAGVFVPGGRGPKRG